MIVIKIWRLISAKKFKKNSCFKGTNHTASGENRSAEGESRSAEGESRSAKGENRSAAGESRSAEGESRSAAGESRSAEGESRSAKGESRSAEGESRSAEGESRSAKGESRSAEGESRSAEGESRSAKGESRSAKGEDRPAKGENRSATWGIYYVIAGIFGDQITVSAELEGKFDITYKQYMGYVKLSRILLEDDPGARKALGVDKIRDRTFAGFLARARQFYLGVQNNDAIFEKLKRFLVSKENLQAQFELLLEVETINSEQENKKGQSQEATLLRNMAFKELFKYRNEFKISARLALAERPQLLDSLGILARSEDYKRKRKKANEEEPEDQTE